LLFAAPFAGAVGQVLHNERLAVDFGDLQVEAFVNLNRVDRIRWIDSSGVARINYVANGGPLICGDPQEFFGQAAGDIEVDDSRVIVPGMQGTWHGGGRKATVTTGPTGGKPCGLRPPAATQTQYTLSNKPSEVNELRVARRFDFNASTPAMSAAGLRAYMARVPVDTYHTVLWPDATGTVINTIDTSVCPIGCQVTDWNGRWFADDDGAGNGMMVIRSAASTFPAVLDVDWDGFSWSNVTSVLLLQPAGGWKAPVSEVEYLCFYDAISWPAAARLAGLAPTGCAGTEP
jgi:hypothetical protein